WQAILIEASLSYLGLSAQPPTPSWGNMLNEGRTYLETAPWISVFPGVAIMIAVLAFNLIGDGLRDILDPNASRGSARRRPSRGWGPAGRGALKRGDEHEPADSPATAEIRRPDRRRLRAVPPRLGPVEGRHA